MSASAYVRPAVPQPSSNGIIPRNHAYDIAISRSFGLRYRDMKFSYDTIPTGKSPETVSQSLNVVIVKFYTVNRCFCSVLGILMSCNPSRPGVECNSGKLYTNMYRTSDMSPVSWAPANFQHLTPFHYGQARDTQMDRQITAINA